MNSTAQNIPSVTEAAQILTASADARARASALSALCAHASTKEGRQTVLKALGTISSVRSALGSAEPKERKNAARLLGAIGTEEDTGALSDALAREKTLFVVPSLLLAIGAIGGEEAGRVLAAYAVPAAETDDDAKHIALITDARNKALAHAVKETVPQLKKLYRTAELLLTYPRGLKEPLLRELTANGFAFRAISDGVLVQADDLDKLFKRRCFYEALIPCGVTECTANAIAAAASEGWKLLCAPGEDGGPKLPYRVELKNAPDDRGALIRDIRLAVGGRNNPSAYAFELRVKPLGNAKASVYVKPCAVRDVRFAYRKGKLPASIHPVTAAAVASEALAVLKPDATRTLRVYDPCCGSGTMLIETAKAFGGRTVLMGTDIMQNAVTVANGNIAAALLRGVILKKDCLKFRPGEPFDLIVSNLPFGNRVGDHAGNTLLYRGLVAQLPSLLKEDGLAVLYTAEGTLLSNLLKGRKDLKVSQTVRTEAGGLLPTVFFITRAQSTVAAHRGLSPQGVSATDCTKTKSREKNV